VSKKFFSLIHGENVHIAPNTKVISGKEFSTLLDAQEVLREVKKDAEKYKVEIVSECETLKEQAQKEGFELGFTEWAEKIVELEMEIKQVRKDMERVIAPIAVKAAKKIVGREIEASESTILDIITNSLKAVAQHKKVTIYVNRKDLEIVEKKREQIKTVFENLEALSIRPKDDITEGGCIIETEGGIINAQLENQWLILEHAFQKLLRQIHPHPVEEEGIKKEVEEVKPEEQEEEEEKEEIVAEAAEVTKEKEKEKEKEEEEEK